MVKSAERMPHPRDIVRFSVTRSGRYPGWRKCRFTFPRGMAMQWFLKPALSRYMT